MQPSTTSSFAAQMYAATELWRQMDRWLRVLSFLMNAWWGWGLVRIGDGTSFIIPERRA